ncbi:MAG: class I SAM-dependent methyltransferase [Flavobacteriales bacterium]
MKLDEKILILLEVLNIPIEQKWFEHIYPESYSVYRYLKNIGLIDENTLGKLESFNGKLETNNRIRSFFKGVDTYWPVNIYKDGAVIDLGSGFGYFTFWLLISGAKKVVSIGDSERIAFIKKLYASAVEKKLLPKDSILFKPDFIKPGDTNLFEEIGENEIDLILLNDTLEHITPRILPYLLKSSYFNLKKGGKFISKQQNSSSAKMYAKLAMHWDEIELSHYISQRKKLIEQAIPNIDVTNLGKLAINTRGLDKYDFKDAVENYKKNKKIPKLSKDSPAVDVVYDIPSEGNTDIPFILGSLKTAGFKKAYVYPALMHSRKLCFLQKVAKTIPSLFFKTTFMDETSVFVATKQ